MIRLPSADHVIRRGTQLVATSCVALALVSCSSSDPDEPSADDPATSASQSTSAPSTPAASPDASAVQDEYCAATRAAAEAKAGTVAEDLAAVRAQAKATRALSTLPDAPAGVEAFAKSADETVAVLEQFPAGDKIADIGLDPRFAAVAKRAAADANYREFITWTLQTCELAPSGG